MGFLLALCILFVPFNTFAFTLTNSSNAVLPEAPPNFSEQLTYAKNNYCNLLFFYDITGNAYYLVSCYDFRAGGTNGDVDFFVGTSSQRIFSNWNANNFGTTYQQYFHVWKCIVGGSSWTSQTIPSTNNYMYFDTTNMRLEAIYSYFVHDTPHQNEIPVMYCDPDTYNNSNYWIELVASTLQYTITNNGQLSGFDSGSGGGSEEPDEPEYSGLLGTIIGWLEDIKDEITDLPTNIQSFFTNLGTTLSTAIGNIQGWLTTLGSNIGNFFSTLWTNLSTSLSNMWTTLSNWFVNLGDRISGFFSTLGDRISGFFVALANDIKSLFVPDDEFWSDYHDSWDTFIDNHFGGLIQAEVVLQDIIGVPPSTRGNRVPNYYYKYSIRGTPIHKLGRQNTRSFDTWDTSLLELLDFTPSEHYYFSIPTLRFRLRNTPGVSSIRYWTIFDGGEYDLDEIMGSNEIFGDYDFRQMWNIAFNSLFAIYGFYRLRAHLFEFINRHEEEGI